MKIIVLKKNLRDALGLVEHAISESGNLPVLKSVLIRASGDALQLSATNLEIAITTTVSGKIVESGGVAVPFYPLYHVVSNVSSERIELETKECMLEVATDNYSAKIQGFPETDFPLIPQVEHANATLALEAHVLRDALTQVVVAAQISEIRPELSGILFDFQLTMLALVATDSFRLARKTLTDKQFKTTCDHAWKAIIPLQAIQEIVRVFLPTHALTCSFDAHQISIKDETTQLVSRLIEGDYPDYEQVTPKAFSGDLAIENVHFMQALKLVSNFSGKVNDIRLKLSADHRSLELYSANQYVGENRYLIPVQYRGEPFDELVFNWRYVLDGARVILSKSIVFSVHKDAKPGLIKSADDASYSYVVMPIRTS